VLSERPSQLPEAEPKLFDLFYPLLVELLLLTMLEEKEEINPKLSDVVHDELMRQIFFSYYLDRVKEADVDRVHSLAVVIIQAISHVLTTEKQTTEQSEPPASSIVLARTTPSSVNSSLRSINVFVMQLLSIVEDSATSTDPVAPILYRDLLSPLCGLLQPYLSGGAGNQSPSLDSMYQRLHRCVSDYGSKVSSNAAVG